MDLSKQIESEQRRLQERSQIAHLQGQVDELRHRLEQQAARSQLASEQARQVQDLFAQLETRFEALVGEAKLQEQTRLRAYQALQKEVAEVRVRVEEPARQLLSLIAQVQDIQESIRLLREQVLQGQEAEKRCEQRVEGLRAQGLLLEERLARLDSLLGQLQEGEEERAQMARQVREEVDAERQSLRRRAADIERLATDLRGEVQDAASRLNRLTELQRQGDTAMKAVEEKMDAVPVQFDRFAAELQRIEREGMERSLQEQERLETLRQSVQRELSDLRKAEERRGESQNTWLRRIEELYHGLDERLARRDEETGRMLAQSSARLDALDKGGEGLLRAMLEVFQRQLERGVEERLRHIETPEADQEADVSRGT